MARRNLSLGFVAGLLAGALVMIVLSAGEDVPRAMAQSAPAPLQVPEPDPFAAPPLQGQPVPPRPPVPAQRYQVAAWAYPAAWSPPNGGVSDRASHGCYILDTASGQMWSIEGSGKPTKLGKIGND